VTWITDTLQAQLNGTTIHVTERVYRFGREVALHRFVGKDAPYSEDTGKLPEWYAVQFVVLGPDYILDRDTVIATLSGPGPYTYTDPTFGDVQVALDSEVQMTERFDGVAEFQVTFHRALDIVGVFITEPSAAAKAAAALVIDKAGKGLVKKWSLGSLVKAILRALGMVATALNVAKGKIASKLGLLDQLANTITQIKDNLSDLMNAPQALVNALKKIVAGIVDLVKIWKDKTPPGIPDGLAFASGDDRGIDALADLGATVRAIPREAVDESTPDGEQEAENLLALHEAVSQIAFGNTIAALVDLVPSTADKSASVVEDIVAWADELLASETVDHDTHNAIADAKALAVDYLITNGHALPSTQIFDAPSPMPACVIAQIVHGIGTADDDITRRNGLRHPLFAQGRLGVLTT
jgi:prophage DNA circulation protein